MNVMKEKLAAISSPSNTHLFSSKWSATLLCTPAKDLGVSGSKGRSRLTSRTGPPLPLPIPPRPFGRLASVGHIGVPLANQMDHTAKKEAKIASRVCCSGGR